MILSDRIASSDQRALTLACEAFSDATQLYQATPLSASGRKGQADARTSTNDGPDAWIRFDVAGKHLVMPVVIEASTSSPGAGVIVNRMHSRATPEDDRPLMFVTQHVTPRLADELITKRIPFLDTAGNVFLQTPEATIMIVGRGKPTLQRLDQTSRSTTPKGMRVTFALLTLPGLVGEPYRTIADLSGVALNTVNLAMDDLMDRGLVVVKGKTRVIVDHRRLVDDWVSLFPTRLRPKLSPRRFTSWTKDKDWWRNPEALDPQARLGGEVAADILTRKIKPATVTVYAPGGLAPKMMSKAMLRPDERGDVEVLEAFWPVEAEDRWDLPDRGVVHPLLVYADLIMSGDDRNREVAQAIYASYVANENA
ncbi:type IV toxin-antitoxin system AbiEi family antitoxin [Paraburkholderia megapolitana]|uniref:type IV toxin-antitoxin system AbiEi family antitoxin n=1 Tax=Paraburkholderia megapolitana TaxID=420953 RepID=UPI0038B76519